MPDDRRLLQLFADPRFQLAVETGEALLQPVGDDGYTPPVPPTLETAGDAALTLFDRPVSLRASVAPVMRIHAAGDALEGYFGDGSSLPAPEGRPLAELALDAAIHLGMAVPARFSEVTVSAHASAGGELSYRHAVPVNPEGRRLDALLRLARTSRIPQLVKIAEVPPGAAHRLEATLFLDFGLDTRVGGDFTTGLATEVFQGLPAALELSGTASARAAVGLGLFDRLAVAVGRGDASATHPDWVRLRIHRTSERQLSFGVVVQLQATYDLGSSLAAILTRAFGEIPPLPRAVETFQGINRLVAAGGWDQVAGQLEDRLADTLGEWLDDTGWQQWAAASPQVRELLDASRRLVDAYQSLGPRLQSWWDGLLGQTDLGPDSPVRRLLSRVAALDPEHLDLAALAGRESTELEGLVELVEVLSGHSLEEILLAPGSRARSLLARAVAEAKRGLAFLDELDAAPGNLMARLQDFARRTGIDGSIRFLAAHATSLDQVEGYVSQRIRELARRLVDPLADHLSADDRRRLEGVAQQIQAVLDAPADLEAKLKQAVSRLRGELGFSLSLEVDRVGRRTALLDLEVDPSGTRAAFHRQVEGGLARGSIAAVLQALDGVEEERRRAEEAGRDPGELPFVLNQCVFQSQRVITGAASTLLHLTGLDRVFQNNRRTVSQRVVESEVRISQRQGDEGGSEDAPGAERRGTWSGGYARTEIVQKMTDRTVVSLVARDAGTGFHRDRPFDRPGASEVGLEIAWLHEDLATHSSELRALDSMLVELGFTGEAGAFAGIQLSDQSRLRLSLEVRFPPAALDAFLADPSEAVWNAAVLEAGRRWFDDHTVWLPAEAVPSVSQGVVLDAVTRSEEFLDKWAVGSRDLAMALGSAGMVARVDGRTVRLEVVKPAGGEWIYRPPYQPLRVLMDRRGQGLKAQQRLARQLAAARDARTAAAYRQLATTAAQAWSRTVAASNSWPSTLFPLWLVRARLAASAPRVLEDVTGVAFLRWQDPGDDTWSGPRGWRLEGMGAGVAG